MQLRVPVAQVGHSVVGGQVTIGHSVIVGRSVVVGQVTIGHSVAVGHCVVGGQVTTGHSVIVGRSVVVGQVTIGHSVAVGHCVVGGQVTTGHSVVVGQVTIGHSVVVGHSGVEGQVTTGHSVMTGVVTTGHSVVVGHSVTIGHSVVTVGSDRVECNSEAKGPLPASFSPATRNVYIVPGSRFLIVTFRPDVMMVLIVPSNREYSTKYWSGPKLFLSKQFTSSHLRAIRLVSIVVGLRDCGGPLGAVQNRTKYTVKQSKRS